MREIVLDTETTGLSPAEGDRVVEIGCVELANHLPTGRHFHIYLNPERDMPVEAFRVHGLSTEFLAEKPLFADEAANFLDFIGDATLIIHNAPFDMGFLKAELERTTLPALANTVIDTVQLARQVHPGARVSLDALCKHYNIDNSKRTLHGALLDSEILAEVYLELIGGRQTGLALSENQGSSSESEIRTDYAAAKRPAPLPIRLGQPAYDAHKKTIAEIGEKALWKKFAG